jgi:hypothetical protein
MPREVTAWVVMPPDMNKGIPEAVFTVKHAMIFFMKKLKKEKANFQDYRVLRYATGRETEPDLFWDMEELISNGGYGQKLKPGEGG